MAWQHTRVIKIKHRPIWGTKKNPTESRMQLKGFWVPRILKYMLFTILYLLLVHVIIIKKNLSNYQKKIIFQIIENKLPIESAYK